MEAGRNYGNGAKKRRAIAVWLTGLRIEGRERFRRRVICNRKGNGNRRNGQVGESHGLIQGGLDSAAEVRGRDAVLKRPAPVQLLDRKGSDSPNNGLEGERTRKEVTGHITKTIDNDMS